MSSIKKNFLYNSTYQVLLILIPLITTPYLSRVLGADGIGVYSYNYSIAYYFGIFILLGLNNYGNRTIAQNRNNDTILSKTFWSIYLMQFALGCIISLLYLMSWVLLFHKDTMTLIMAVYVISNVFDINWLFFGLEKFKLITIRNIGIKILTTVSIFILVKNESSVGIYSLIMVSGMLLSQLIMWPYVFRNIPFYLPSIKEITVHFKPNCILFLTVLATSMFKIMDKIMLGAMTTKTQVGFYESSERVIAIPIALIVSLGTVMLPRMSNIIASDMDKDIEKIIGKSVVFALFLSSSICFGIMGISKTFVPFFYGEGFDECILLYQILLPSCVFLAFANVVRTQYILPNQLDKIYVVSAFLGAGVNLITNYLLIPKWHASGAAFGTLLSEISVCLYQCLKVRHSLPFKKYLFHGYPFVLSGITMYLIISRFEIYESSIIRVLFLKIILGVAVYFISLFSQEIILRVIFKKSFLDKEFYLK